MTDPYAGPAPKVSFEIFPPKTEKGEAHLARTVEALDAAAPSFFSVTYGAGGSTRERTFRAVEHIQKNRRAPVAAHLTCVAAACDEIDRIADWYWEAGVRHIVALRGDPPEGVGEAYRPHPRGYAYAADLVAGLKARHDFDISVAGYPETHPQAASSQADIDNLKRKVDAGARRVITQYFFDNGDYLRFRDRAAAAGVAAVLEPGVMPIANFETAVKFSAACGARIPDWMPPIFTAAPDESARRAAAIRVLTEQCLGLLREGVEELHFYTLNRAELTLAVCNRLGVTGAEPRAA